MEWSRIKTVIIAILLILNTVLLFLLVRDTISKRTLREDALRDLRTVMENNGVRLTAGELPDAGGVYALTSERNEAKESEICGKLLGEYNMEDKGGNIHYYHSGLGEIYFRGTGDFELTIFTVDDAVAQKLRGLFEENGVALPAGLYGSAMQTVGGLPVYDALLTAESNSGGVRVTGRWIVSATAPDADKPALDAPTALVRFISEMNLKGIICTEITGIELGYSMIAPVAGDFELTPEWKITTDTGAYYLNGVTGELKK